MTLGNAGTQYPVPPALEHPELLTYRAEFPILQRKTYLNSCALGALSTRVIESIERCMGIWNEWGSHSWTDFWTEEVARLRQKFARLIGAQPHEIAIAPNVSTAISSIATALDYAARPNVVLSERDFPSLAYQWLVKEQVECRFVESPDGVYVPPELYQAKIDEKTALVANSRVYYNSGYIQDIRAIADIAHKHGAYMLVDDYQGTGQLPLNVNTLDIDFLVTGTAKWLLGGPGLALVYIREGLIPRIKPTIAGWRGNRDLYSADIHTFEFRSDATRIELGTPAILSIYSANSGLELIQEASVESISERTRYLTNDLVARAREQGWTVKSPQEPECRSSIVMLEFEQPQEIAQELLKRDIIVDSNTGLLRIAPYFYNTIEENAIVIEAIAEILTARQSSRSSET
jgi:selenocysteine lyase/cysteine desulfurase